MYVCVCVCVILERARIWQLTEVQPLYAGRSYIKIHICIAIPCIFTPPPPSPPTNEHPHPHPHLNLHLHPRPHKHTHTLTHTHTHTHRHTHAPTPPPPHTRNMTQARHLLGSGVALKGARDGNDAGGKRCVCPPAAPARPLAVSLRSLSKASASDMVRAPSLLPSLSSCETQEAQADKSFCLFSHAL